MSRSLSTLLTLPLLGAMLACTPPDPGAGVPVEPAPAAEEPAAAEAEEPAAAEAEEPAAAEAEEPAAAEAEEPAAAEAEEPPPAGGDGAGKGVVVDGPEARDGDVNQLHDDIFGAMKAGNFDKLAKYADQVTDEDVRLLLDHWKPSRSWDIKDGFVAVIWKRVEVAESKPVMLDALKSERLETRAFAAAYLKGEPGMWSGVKIEADRVAELVKEVGP